MTIYRHRFSGLGSSQELWVATLHTESSVSLATAHAAAHAFAVGVFGTDLHARYSTIQAFESTVTDALDPVTGRNTVQARSDQEIFGTATDQVQSARNCLVVSLQTGTATRHGRGRMFLPGLTAASQSGEGGILGSARDSIAAALGARMTTLAATSQPVIYQRPIGIPPKPFTAWTAGHTIPVTRLSISSQWGTQRRRTNKTPLSTTFASV